jgi:hypothetical protein
MGTEVLRSRTLTHADAAEYYPAQRPAQHPAFCMRLERFTIDTHMNLFFAGATHSDQSRVCEQIPVTLKRP